MKNRKKLVNNRVNILSNITGTIGPVKFNKNGVISARYKTYVKRPVRKYEKK